MEIILERATESLTDVMLECDCLPVNGCPVDEKEVLTPDVKFECDCLANFPYVDDEEALTAESTEDRFECDCLPCLTACPPADEYDCLPLTVCSCVEEEDPTRLETRSSPTSTCRITAVAPGAE
jgi:hypothetical protein